MLGPFYALRTLRAVQLVFQCNRKFETLFPLYFVNTSKLASQRASQTKKTKSPKNRFFMVSALRKFKGDNSLIARMSGDELAGRVEF